MTILLKEAFAKASRLPQVEQNTIARWMLEELASDRRWERAFGESEATLSMLAKEGIEEHRSGKTHKLRPDRL